MELDVCLLKDVNSRIFLAYHHFMMSYQVFAPLVEKCKKYGRAMRIGTNHGSLSDRIMSYYGDSPRGMVRTNVFCSDPGL